MRLLPDVTERRFKDPVGLVAFVDEFLSPQECDRVLAIAEPLQVHEGRTGAQGKADGARDSGVRFIYPQDASQWLFTRLEQALERLNEGYEFELQGFYEGAQVASYAPGGHYDWHMDLGTDGFSTRKLSMSVQLSAPEDYQGGELEFIATDERAPTTRGSLIVFPSFVVHRIRPVTAGTRWSLVSWISGPAFR